MRDIDLINMLALAGSLASIIGIPLALIAILQARNAARRSEAEARSAKNASIHAQEQVEKFRRDLRLITNVVDFEKAVSLMGDIKTFIRHANFGPVPDRISSLVLLLNNIRSPASEIGEKAERKIQESVVALRRVEDAITKSTLSGDKPADAAKLIRAVSKQIDLLQPIMVDLRNRIGDSHE